MFFIEAALILTIVYLNSRHKAAREDQDAVIDNNHIDVLAIRIDRKKAELVKLDNNNKRDQYYILRDEITSLEVEMDRVSANYSF